jgi:hypothetical protein
MNNAAEAMTRHPASSLILNEIKIIARIKQRRENIEQFSISFLFLLKISSNRCVTLFV